MLKLIIFLNSRLKEFIATTVYEINLDYGRSVIKAVDINNKSARTNIPSAFFHKRFGTRRKTFQPAISC